MKKIKNVIMIIVILISISDVSLAHGGNKNIIGPGLSNGR